MSHSPHTAAINLIHALVDHEASRIWHSRMVNLMGCTRGERDRECRAAEEVKTATSEALRKAIHEYNHSSPPFVTTPTIEGKSHDEQPT